MRRAVGINLQRLRTNRNHADYYDDLPVTTSIHRKAEEVIARAERVILALP